MNDAVLDSLNIQDTTAQVTVITHLDGLTVTSATAGVQVHTVGDSALFVTVATEDGSAHYVEEIARAVPSASDQKYVSQTHNEVFSAGSRVTESQYVLEETGEAALAVEDVQQIVSMSAHEPARIRSVVGQTAVAVGVFSEVLQANSFAGERSAAVVEGLFLVRSAAEDFIARMERIAETFSAGNQVAASTLTADIVKDVVSTNDDATSTTVVTAASNDRFNIYSRAVSTADKTQTTSGWIANALGMAMSRMVGSYPMCRAGGYAGGRGGLYRMGQAPITVDTGSVRASKNSERVRVSNVYCDGQLANASLAFTAEDDVRDPQTYNYAYRGRAGISNGRFDTGKGLTCQRVRLVITAASIQLNRIQVVGGVSNRRV